MDYELQKEASIEGLGVVSYVDAPFDEALKLVKKSRIISARDMAYARIHSGVKSSLCENGSYVREGVLYVPNQESRIFLVRPSLVLQNPDESVDAHRNGKEFFVDAGLARNLAEQSGTSGKVIAVKSLKPILTEWFGVEEVTDFLFGDQAKEYGLFLKNEKGIQEMPLAFDTFDYIDSKRMPYANQLWLARLDYDSQVYGYNRLLSNYLRVRGVQSITAEGGLAKDLSYTRRQISKALHNQGISGDLEKRIIESLKVKV